MWAVATGQNYLLKIWRGCKLDKQKGFSWAQEGNGSALWYLHLPTSSDSPIGFLIQMVTQILMSHCSLFVHSAFPSLPFSSSFSEQPAGCRWRHDHILLQPAFEAALCQSHHFCHCALHEVRSSNVMCVGMQQSWKMWVWESWASSSPLTPPPAWQT